jgi:hypothetical protein
LDFIVDPPVLRQVILGGRSRSPVSPILEVSKILGWTYPQFATYLPMTALSMFLENVSHAIRSKPKV